MQFRTLIAALSCLALAACSDSTDPSESIVGTYHLQTVNGSSLPFVLQSAGPKIELVSEDLVVNATGTFSVTTVIRTTDGTSVTTTSDVEAGTYTVAGNSTTFTDSEGSAGSGTLSDGTITLTNEGVVLVFMK